MGRVICCCGAECLTKLIAVLQIIGSAIYLATLTIVFVLVVISGKDKIETNISNFLKDNPALGTFGAFGGALGYSEIIVAILISLGFTCFAFLMGVLLLIGANKKNVRYLTFWQVVAVIFMVASVLAEIFVRNTQIINVVFYLLFLIIWTIFLVWVVQVFKRDIIREKEAAEEES